MIFGETGIRSEFRQDRNFHPLSWRRGAERVMVTLANAFAQRGYAVDLVLAAAQGPQLQNVRPEVRIVDLNAARVIKALLPLVRYLRRERPVAMLSAMTHANVIAILARMLARLSTRLVISERTTMTAGGAQEKSLAARFIHSLVPKLYPRADGITAVSFGAAEDLVRFASLPEHTVEVIYNPFDLEHIAALANEALDHPWFESGQPPVVLAIGRLNEAKDFSTLIRAFAGLRVSRPARLLILGEGEQRPALEKLATQCGLGADDFQMPGYTNNPFAYLAHCGVFVLSSRLEGLPGVLIEAMACGAPVVSTNCPSGPSEILEAGRWGRLVPVGDEEALSEAMNAVLSTPRAALPDVRLRARDFEQEKAVDAYLCALGLPPTV